MNPDVQKKIVPGRMLAALLLLAVGAVLVGCNGSITSVALPPDSPWTDFGTVIASPYDDLSVVTLGSDIAAGFSGAGEFAVCTSDQGGFYAACDAPGCAPDPLTECVVDAPAGVTGVGFSGLATLYQLVVSLDRPAFTTGGVELVSASVGTVGAISIQIGSSSSLNIGATFNEGLIAGPSFDPNVDGTFELADNFSGLALAPHWDDFQPGYVCTDGTTTSCNPDVSTLEDVLALCIDNGSEDILAFRNNAITAPYSLDCGSVTVNVNPTLPYNGFYQCKKALIAQHCTGLTGTAKLACNHTQTAICKAAFNVVQTPV